MNSRDPVKYEHFEHHHSKEHGSWAGLKESGDALELEEPSTISTKYRHARREQLKRHVRKNTLRR